MRLATSLSAATVVLLFGAATASAQSVTYYYAPPAPVTTYYASPAPVTTYYASPAPVTAYSPVVVDSAPVVAYSPSIVTAPAPVVTYRAAAPVVAYSPVVSAYAAPVYVGRPVVARTKFYVPGQPIRNFFRAITP